MDGNRKFEDFVVDALHLRSHARTSARMKFRRIIRVLDVLLFDVLQVVTSCAVMITATAYVILPAWTLRAFAALWALWQIATLLIIALLCAAAMCRVWRAATRPTPRDEIRKAYLRQMQHIRLFYE